ncbi:MAG: hypothetical protein K8W52_25605 [Deltaproteobacteria bacterium]|nr:hypothetical protein [Deltaproteobacteria bacterium]
MARASGRLLALLLGALAACAAGANDPAPGRVDATAAIDAAPSDAMLIPDAAPAEPAPDATADASVDAALADAGALAVTLFGTTPTAYAGHTTSVGSTLANDICPAGQVLTGLRGRLRGTDLYHGPIWGACRPLILTATPPTLTTGTPTTDLPEHGSPLAGDTAWSRDCADGEVLVGLAGRAGAIIDQLELQCAPLQVAPQAPYTVTLGAAHPLATVGDLAGGSLFTPIACPADQLGRGLSTYFDGDPGFGLGAIYLDGVAIVCTTATVQ